MNRITSNTKTVLIISLLSLLLGCAAGPVGRLPVIQNSNKAGSVTVMRNRNYFGGGQTYYVTLDDKKIFKIKKGQYTKFQLNPGKYFIGVKCFGGWAPVWNDYSIPINVLPKEKIHFIISPSGSSCGEIEKINKDMADYIIKKDQYQYISMEQDETGGTGEFPHGN